MLKSKGITLYTNHLQNYSPRYCLPTEVNLKFLVPGFLVHSLKSISLKFQADLINDSWPHSRQKLKIGRGREEISPPAPEIHGPGNPGRLPI